MESSTANGNKLEAQVYDLLQKLINNDSFLTSAKTSKVFRKKGYFSNKRKDEIIFDVTIEVTFPLANKYSNLYVFECKNLNQKVSVDDIEEFGSKLNQVGEHNTKGILVTTVGFERGCLEIAKAEGIGLVRISTNKDFEWILYRKNSNSDLTPEFENELLSDNFTSEPFICFLNDTRITNFADLLLKLSIIDYFTDSEEFIEIPFVTHEKFNLIVEKYIKNSLYDGDSLNLDKLITFLEPVYNVKFEYDNLKEKGILGKIEFNPLTIKINKEGIDNNRIRFTTAHEIGHLILHSQILKNRISSKSDDDSSLALKYSGSKRHSEILEIQANLFASYILLPEPFLRSLMNGIFISYRIPKKIIFLDSQPVNQKQAYEILNILSEKFQVSVEAIKIRLLKLNLLIDKTDYRLGTLIREYFH